MKRFGGETSKAQPPVLRLFGGAYRRSTTLLMRERIHLSKAIANTQALTAKAASISRRTSVYPFTTASFEESGTNMHIACQVRYRARARLNARFVTVRTVSGPLDRSEMTKSCRRCGLANTGRQRITPRVLKLWNANGDPRSVPPGAVGILRSPAPGLRGSFVLTLSPESLNEKPPAAT